MRAKCYKGMDNYRFDNFIEYALSRRGRGDLTLLALAAGCVAGIVVLGRH